MMLKFLKYLVDVETVADAEADSVELGFRTRCSNCTLSPAVECQRYLKYRGDCARQPDVDLLESVLVAQSLSQYVLM